MKMLDEEDTDLSKLLCIRNEEGRPVVRIGLLATMFLAEPYTRPVREAVTEAAEEYMLQVRDHLRWSQDRGGYFHPIDSGKVPFPREWLPQHEDGQVWHLGFHGGDGDEDASEFQVSAVGAERRPKPEFGHFQFYLPLTWFTEHPGTTFSELVWSFANLLHPVSGYAGIGVLDSLDFSARQDSGEIVRKLAERFPGLEVEGYLSQSLYVGEGVKGASWLTLLSDHWVKEIGGLDYLRIRLGEDFKLTPYAGGVMIQAGPKPQLGDVTMNRWPRHYVTLAKVLKPIQVKVHGAFHWGDATRATKRMDHAATLAWLFRFDGK